MKFVLRSPDEPPCEAGKDLSVVIMGEDAAMARSAGEILKPLNLNHIGEGRLVQQLWHPDFLIFNELRELAAMAAAVADIIVISVREGKALSGSLKLWLKRWLDLRQDRPGALVAVLDSDWDNSDATPGILPQLKAAALRGHLDFFVTRAKDGRDEAWGLGRNPAAGPGNSNWRVVNPGATRIAGRRREMSRRNYPAPTNQRTTAR